MSRWTHFAMPAAVLAMAVLSPAAANAQIKAPGCEALAAWLSKVDLRDREKVNRHKTYGIATAMKGDEMVRLFGKAGPDFTQDDVAAARKIADDCEKAAGRAKDRQAAKLFAGLESEFQRNLGPVLKEIETGNAKLPPALDKFESIPPGIEKLRAVAALLSYARTLDDRQAGIILSGIDRSVDADTRAIFDALRSLPEAAVREKMQPRIEPQFAPAREAAVKEVRQKLAALPETAQGLRGIDSEMQMTRHFLSRALSPEDMALFEKEVDARRDQIERALLAQAKQKIDAMPANVMTLSMLTQSGARPVAGGLPPLRVQELEAHAEQRKAVLRKSVVDDAVTAIGSSPATIAGLGELDAFRRNFIQQAGPLVGTEIQRFDAAVKARAAEVARGARPAFEKELAALPETAESLGVIDRQTEQIVAYLMRLDPSARALYEEPARKRRAAIAAKVEAEEKRLAALPLAGQTFANPIGVKVEFRDRRRAYVTLPAGGMQEASYEQDGDRIILRMPNSNTVLERKGATLVIDGVPLRPVVVR
jgi:hypothetical protein